MRKLVKCTEVVMAIAVLMLVVAVTVEEVSANDLMAVDARVISVYDGDTIKVDVPEWPDLFRRQGWC